MLMEALDPAPENSLGGQTLPETDPFIEYGRATQEEEDPDASDFEESIDNIIDVSDYSQHQ